MIKIIKTIFTYSVIITICNVAFAQTHQQTATGKVQSPTVDSQFLDVYKLIAQQKYTDAINKLNIILIQYPNFELAQALKNDLLTMSNSNDVNSATNKVLNSEGIINLDNKNYSYNQSASLREEAKLRIKAIYERPDARLIPRALLNLAPRQKTALIVDPQRSRIYVYENVNGRPKFLFDYYITIGKQGFNKEAEGDNKTPIGVYNLLPLIPKAKLPEMYGYGAMPLTFPNDWDNRNNITGHNIWIHGVPNHIYSRPPRASEGCVVLTNPDLERLFKFTQTNTTPVIINKSTEWVDVKTWKQERKEAMHLVEKWQDAWNTYDFESYMKLYSPTMFKSDKKNYQEWMKKYFIFFDQKQIKLQNMRHLSIYRYPNNDIPTLLITFEQDMMIPNFASKEKDAMKQSIVQKRQYWQYDGIQWEIVYENES